MSMTGSCLCGGVKYEVDKIGDDIDHCHCTFCQKSHAAAFGTYVNVAPEDFRWLEGEALLARYQSSSHSARVFCSRCGSSLQADIEGGKACALTLATLDNPPDFSKGWHMFVRSKAPWYEINDELPQYEVYPPAFDHLTPTD